MSALNFNYSAFLFKFINLKAVFIIQNCLGILYLIIIKFFYLNFINSAKWYFINNNLLSNHLHNFQMHLVK